jgi:hypothetical protein
MNLLPDGKLILGSREIYEKQFSQRILIVVTLMSLVLLICNCCDDFEIAGELQRFGHAISVLCF